MDNRNVGSKNWDWIKKGVPIRFEVDPRSNWGQSKIKL
jgi:hypothetical protein